MRPFFSQETLVEIRYRADIVDIISEYVSLKKVGKNYLALCPFHAEKTPSFTVNEEKQVFYCFGCQKGGDVITFLREMQNISFVEAASQLADRYGISVPSSFPVQEKKDEKEVFFKINEKVVHYYHQILIKRPEGEAGRKYLKKRGIGPKVWDVFKLGFAPDCWDGLVNFLSSENVPLELAKNTGLISPKKRGGFFDCFRGRIIFPIFNLNGKTIGFGGRTITGADPKYLNSADSIVYKKRFSLFGLPMTRNYIRQEGRVFVVEGYFDLLRMYQSGICAVVSPLGTALTPGHIHILKGFTSNFYIVFDADEAGDKAALRSLELFLDKGISPRVVILPPGSDPDDLIMQKGVESFFEQIEHAPLLLTHYIDKTIQEKDISIPEGKIEVLKTIMPIINRIDQPIVQDEYIRRLSEKLEVREDRIRTFRKVSYPAKPKDLPSEVDGHRPEKFLLTLMLQKPEVILAVDKARVIEDFESPFFKEIGKVVIESFRKEGKLDLINLIDKLGEEQRNFATALSFKEENFGSLIDGLKDCIHQIKRNKIRKMQANLTKKIKKAQKNRDEAEVRDLHKQKIQLILQEKDLNNNILSLLNL